MIKNNNIAGKGLGVTQNPTICTKTSSKRVPHERDLFKIKLFMRCIFTSSTNGNPNHSNPPIHLHTEQTEAPNIALEWYSKRNIKYVDMLINAVTPVEVRKEEDTTA